MLPAMIQIRVPVRISSDFLPTAWTQEFLTLPVHLPDKLLPPSP